MEVLMETWAVIEVRNGIRLSSLKKLSQSEIRRHLVEEYIVSVMSENSLSFGARNSIKDVGGEQSSGLSSTFTTQSLEHPPYSPDLASRIFHPLGPLKKQLEGRNFRISDKFSQPPPRGSDFGASMAQMLRQP
ncbi:hypothetical protein AVEN_34812-1 [Araneus ventricosus]|uniref:Uncharacterized protein n=1 Tax=Araneus ventricosus TaxID=182803 RepID=A0A4Y2N636_ARAVE|nr:hypothetical protein AVEN_34812-1 [Araneus ventricosus]